MIDVLNPVISVDQLVDLQKKEEVVLIDSRYGNQADQEYIKGHLKGAFFVDLDQDLADIKDDPANGGRHPLPTIEHFIKVLNCLGITNLSRVVIYDNNSGAFASRMWWMLKSIGHENVHVLDGGYDIAVSKGYAVIKGEEIAINEGNYKANHWDWPMASLKEVEKAVNSNEYMVIDVRSNVRYNGEIEPIDLVAGHIPGAVNIPFVSNLNESKEYLSVSELSDKYQKALGNIKSDQVIVHCGSGVTACHTILAMSIAKMPIPKLYIGSWSEWSRNKKPIATDK
jgi:thiosulfate/3-mercaptopyruvate sulfurtransferase